MEGSAETAQAQGERAQRRKLQRNRDGAAWERGLRTALTLQGRGKHRAGGGGEAWKAAALGWVLGLGNACLNKPSGPDDLSGKVCIRTAAKAHPVRGDTCSSGYPSCSLGRYQKRDAQTRPILRKPMCLPQGKARQLPAPCHGGRTGQHGRSSPPRVQAL